MFTSADKAIVSLLSSGIYLLNSFGVTHISPEVVTSILTIAPALVWLIPNKNASATAPAK